MMRLQDLFIDTPLSILSVEEAIYRSALWNSGVVEIVPEVQQKVSANDGRTFQSRYWKDLPEPDDTDNITYTDDSDDLITTNKITHGLFTMFKAMPSSAWGEKDVIKAIGTLPDPLGVISDRLQFFWGRYFDKYALAQMSGVVASNVANDSGDMVHDISDNTAAPDATNTINASAVIDAQQTAGDSYDDFQTMIVNSVVMANLRKQNLIDTIPSSDGRTKFNYYQDLRVLVSDKCPVDTTGTYPVYTTYIMGSGVFGFGEDSSSIINSELWRDPRTGQGGGETQIITRQHFSLHPLGFNWTDTTVTGSTQHTSGNPLWPNMADNRLAANWTRAATDRKQIRAAVLLTNG